VLIFDEDRASGSAFVERVWRSHSEGPGSFVSIAESRAELVVTRYRGQATLTVRGPETRATRAFYPPDAEWLGIRFKPGAYIVAQPASKLVNRKVTLPQGTRNSFWLNGSAWQVPDFDNADTFVEWLARDDLLVIDPAVRAALLGEHPDSSLRTLQRRFLQATGVTQTVTRRIERARCAALLLKSGVPITSAAYQAGYFDQPHLTRSVQHFIGQTPAQLLDKHQLDQLSFLYKTQPFVRP
jgi:AraC-like DNA-binding protein